MIVTKKNFPSNSNEDSVERLEPDNVMGLSEYHIYIKKGITFSVVLLYLILLVVSKVKAVLLKDPI